ncbi:MAG TPA: hypothetical protein VL996_05610 [Methylocella sp.]|nr:hypothetical protein [Methylocella sp.]
MSQKNRSIDMIPACFSAFNLRVSFSDRVIQRAKKRSPGLRILTVNSILAGFVQTDRVQDNPDTAIFPTHPENEGLTECK